MAADILHSHPLVEEIFATHRDHAQGDEAGYDGYRGHAYRVLDLARAITPDAPDRDDKLAVAAAFHDLDAFTSLDYLATSIRAQDAWLERAGRAQWGQEGGAVARGHFAATITGFRPRPTPTTTSPRLPRDVPGDIPLPDRIALVVGVLAAP